MDFKVGNTLVYPHHGAFVIEDIETRELNGEEIEYLVLKICQSDLVIRVPLANAEKVGIREVVDKKGLETVFGVLREEDVDESTNWSRRFKANQERLASGDVNRVAEVVRDLWRRDRVKGLSAGEKRLLVKARQMLVGELALATLFHPEKADAIEEELNAALAKQLEVKGPEKPKEVDLDDLDLEDED